VDVTERDNSNMTIEQIGVPASARELTEVEPIDYEDAFLVDPAPAAWRPAEAAAQAVLGDAPAKLREALLAGWSSLGLRLGPDGGRQVLGWQLRRADPEVAVLAADSPLGIEAELVFARQGHALLYATFVRLDGESARAAWSQVEPVHPPMVRRLLERAASHTRFGP
jgi:hypothetical protein